MTDPTGAVIEGANISLVDVARQTTYRILSGKGGLYIFPNLPVGQYTLTIEARGFGTQRRQAIELGESSSVRMDVVLEMGARADTVNVPSDAGLQVEFASTSLGSILPAAQITSIPLNGRSYTDLLALQPGVAPISTQSPSSVIMAGVTGSIDPSGDLNPGNQSISGQRESSNGFLVNGIDVQEHMNGGTSIIPNLDSIEQFQVLTNNFDSEFGNYDGGMVTLTTKEGADSFHGAAFDFFRNTALDARGYFDPERSALNQNQFGGTIGGPVLRKRAFFFADYQGTRTTEGVSTGNITVPSFAQRNGIFSQGELTGHVSGPYFAQLLTQQLGYAVTAGEAYSSVFPAGAIPHNAWSAPATNLLRYIPVPNVGVDQFSTAASSQSVRDDKGALRLDASIGMGQVSAYYFTDDYTLDNPYPGSVAGASVPGFDALYLGRAQLLSLADTKLIGANAVNELHLGYLRNANVIGQPRGGLGVSLTSQGFSTGPDGIYLQAPQFEGIENITFPTFVMGVPITNLSQVNNTLFVSDTFLRQAGSHALKVGAQFHLDQVNNHPNATFNGTFNINGTETGSAYADFLLGTASNFTQSSGQPFYLRNHYVGLYVQDSWRVTTALTVNAGLRWDFIVPWSEKYHQLQTYISGAQSTLFPGAPPGLVAAGDSGVPDTIAPASFRNFAPRIGFAYSRASENGLGRLLFGSRGKSSLRASYGLFYTGFPGLAAGIMYAVPPFGYNYLSPGPPLLATPFITAATGYNNGQRFPFSFPSHNVSATAPDSAVDWSRFLPLSADPFFDHRNRAAYLSSYMLSYQRQLSSSILLTISYAGNQGHHQLALISANPGNPELCLRLISAGCGPFGEDTTYTSPGGRAVYGTRSGQAGGGMTAQMYGENTSDRSIANSNYNALETTLRYAGHGSQLLLSYTYAKSIDQGSNLGEQLNPVDQRQSRTISAWDIKHDLVASYTIALPLDLRKKGRPLIRDWSVSGSTRFASGFPVTLLDNSDNSLLGTLGNGANNYLLDTPEFKPGPLHINSNGRSNQPAFNRSLFSEEVLGHLGNARRRMFYGPGISNYDLTMQKLVRLEGVASIDLRVEAFNAFNHAQFYGPSAVDGQIEDSNFGRIISAQAPRLVQVAAKFIF